MSAPGTALKLQPLPPDALALLRANNASPRLIAHLRLVHDVAYKLLDAVAETWPNVILDRQDVLFGAATHDIGKAIHRAEIIGPGQRHEQAGYELLIAAGIAAQRAKFAQSHGDLCDLNASSLEELLVALADKVWKGKRADQLELELAGRIALYCRQEVWSVFAQLDAILTIIAEDADPRLRWQARHAL